MSRCVSLSPCKANEHGCHTSATTKNNVDGDRDVVAEGKVIEEIDSKEEDNVREPTSQGYSSDPEEERGIRCGEVCWPGEQSRYQELDKGDEKT